MDRTTVLILILCVCGHDARAFSSLKIGPMLDRAIDDFEAGDQKDVVLIVGNNRSGKTSLASLLSGLELKAVQADVNSTEFRIKDEAGLIGGDSQSLVPNLMVDEKNGISYYDCVQYRDLKSRGKNSVSFYILQQLLDSVNSVKFLFTIKHEFVQIGGNTTDFMTFAELASRFIKHIEKYQNGIGLVVTMVNATQSDNQIIVEIAEFLNRQIHELNAEPQQNAKKIKFIETLLRKDPTTNQYSRIRIQRLATKAGPLKDMEQQQNNRNAIISMVKNLLEYVHKDDGDFQYPIHKMATFGNRFKSIVANISSEIVNFYLQQEDHISDISLLNETMSSAHQQLAHIDLTQPEQFKNQLLNAANHLNVSISPENIQKMDNDIKFAAFLKSVSNQENAGTFEIVNEFTNATKYISESMNWYGHLIELHSNISELTEQQKIGSYDTSTIVTKVVAESKISPSPRKLQLLRAVLDQTTKRRLDVNCTTDKLTLKGYNVKLSDAVNCDAKSIEIIALNKFYVDVEFRKSTRLQQISIIAPKWEVGNGSFVLDNLDGSSASDFLGIAGSIERNQNGSGHFYTSGNSNKSFRFVSFHFAHFFDCLLNNVFGIDILTGTCQKHLYTLHGEVDGSDCEGRNEMMIFNDSTPPQIINEFKKFAGEQLPNHILASKIRKFIDDVDQNERIQSFYKTKDFAREFLELEMQYNHLKKQIDLIPFYKSISQRVSDHQKKLSEVDRVLYGTIASNLYAKAQAKIQSKEDSKKTVLNLLEYLDNVEKDIDSLKKSEDKMKAYVTIPAREIDTIISVLDVMIQTNALIEKHEIAIETLKQHKFPFVFEFLSQSEFETAANLPSNDTQLLKQTAIRQIENARWKVARSEYAIVWQDEIAGTGVFESGYVSTTPFFVWKHRNNKNLVKKLLRGENILIEADITKQADWDWAHAVKFIDIKIQLKTKNARIQTELDERLANFQASMKMIGNGYYRCGNRVFSFPDAHMEIKYLMVPESKGIPTPSIGAYNATSKRDAFLSPYGMWSIQLRNVRNDLSLRKFENYPIDMELVGNARYVPRRDTNRDRVCPEMLNKVCSLHSIVA